MDVYLHIIFVMKYHVENKYYKILYIIITRNVTQFTVRDLPILIENVEVKAENLVVDKDSEAAATEISIYKCYLQKAGTYQSQTEQQMSLPRSIL
jgi:hypothetical protein